jgi:uncharacterized cupin superfamily protein
VPIVDLSEQAHVATEYGRWAPLNGALGLTGFGINAFVADLGERTDAGHDETESGQQELFIVVAGAAVITVDGVEHVARPGTLVSAPDPSTSRSIRVLERGTRLVCLGALPGTGGEGFGDWIVPG